MNELEQELIKKFESITPEEYLKAIYNVEDWKDIYENDLKLVNEYRKKGLNDSVINVLLDYVIISCKGRLSKALFMKMASHWLRKKITTVEQAMKFAREYHDTYKEWAKDKEKAKHKPHGLPELNSIRGAIVGGLTDEQLGKYVRRLLATEDK